MKPESPRGELRPLLQLAVPVALGEFAWMAMGLVDTVMLGRIDSVAIGGLAIGRVVFMNLAVIGIGLLLGLDATVSQAYGADDRAECLRQRTQGLWLAGLVSVPLMIAFYLSLPALSLFGIDPELMPDTLGYMHAVGFGMIPLLFYTALRRFLQSIDRVQPIMWALISANLINVALNEALIFGRLGLPKLGTAGAGYATSGSLVYLVVFLWVTERVVRRRPQWSSLQVSRRFDPRRFKELLRLGVPASVQITFEVALFTFSAIWIGQLGATELAAHQVALVLASAAYMIPLGVSSAAAVRVGHAIGAGDPWRARRAGWTAIATGTGVMAFTGLLFAIFPAPLIRVFSNDAQVVALGVPVLYLCATFQLVDGFGVVAIGALRGAGQTFQPMIWTLVGYWGLTLPLGWYLTFSCDFGLIGMWAALCIGLILVACAIGVIWVRWSRKLIRLAA